MKEQIEFLNDRLSNIEIDFSKPTDIIKINISNFEYKNHVFENNLKYFKDIYSSTKQQSVDYIKKENTLVEDGVSIDIKKLYPTIIRYTMCDDFDGTKLVNHTYEKHIGNTAYIFILDNFDLLVEKLPHLREKFNYILNLYFYYCKNKEIIEKTNRKLISKISEIDKTEDILYISLDRIILFNYQKTIDNLKELLKLFNLEIDYSTYFIIGKRKLIEMEKNSYKLHGLPNNFKNKKKINDVFIFSGEENYKTFRRVNYKKYLKKFETHEKLKDILES